MTAYQKFGGFNDYRGGGHFSGRITVGLVAAGVVAKKLLPSIDIKALVTEAGGDKNIRGAVENALEKEDSIGGIVECRVKDLPPGLGEPFFDSLESLISHIVFSIPGVKAIEFGAGFSCAEMPGSEYNDEILDISGRTESNNSGGINGGISNGNEIVYRVALRPAASIKKTRRTVNLKSGEPEIIYTEGRHDTCIALRAPVIVEAVTAIVLADLMMISGKIPRILNSYQQSAISSQ